MNHSLTHSLNQIHALTVPKWGMAMEEGDIIEWHVNEGDKVCIGDELVDIETSKIVNVVEASANGILHRIVGQVGEKLSVGALLGVIAEAAVTATDIDNFIAQFSGAKLIAENITPMKLTAEKPAAPVMTPILLEDANAAEDDSAVNASNIARRLATKLQINLNQVTPTGRNGRVAKRDIELHLHQPAKDLALCLNDSEVKATPVAQRLAKALGLSLSSIVPTDSRGRITKADVERAASVNRSLESISANSDEKSAAERVPAPMHENAFDIFPLSGMRKTIASRLTQSKQTTPHFRAAMAVAVDELHRLRLIVNETSTSSNQVTAKVSLNDFIIKACAKALMAVPQINVQFAGDAIHQYKHADIAFAVALEGGLITPIIRQADKKSITQIAEETKDLVDRAKRNRLKLEEFEGGTFSISNLGMYGIDEFDAIINPPQAAILAISASKKCPIVKSDELVIATMMNIQLSCDHRVIDGAIAAKFLQVLKGYLENPVSMLV